MKTLTDELSSNSSYLVSDLQSTVSKKSDSHAIFSEVVDDNPINLSVQEISRKKEISYEIPLAPLPPSTGTNSKNLSNNSVRSCSIPPVPNAPSVPPPPPPPPPPLSSKNPTHKTYVSRTVVRMDPNSVTWMCKKL